ncbi:BREX-2 system phosphatase PglZ [Streptomyces sp. NPDC005474]|uniref:BREX-2 system phosphatase PglZ n=1 Tax=Streptomyces sp. NPDC005474 TaxID=3154878 RepID=UPI003455E9DB
MSTRHSTTTAPQGPDSGRTRPRPAHPAAVAQVLEARSFTEGEPRTVLIRAEPHWNGPRQVTLSRGRTARIAAAVSPLAVLDVISTQGQDAEAADGRDILAILTDAEEADLGPGLLARVYRNRIYPIEPWAVVRRLFGARDLDPRLTAETWAAEALIDAAGQENWPKTPGAVLSRDTALSRLTATRLSTSVHRLDAADIDLPALLGWSMTPGAAERLASLREQERRGLTEWITDPDRVGRRAHQALTALFALFEAGHGQDAVPMGLVCAALWGPSAQASADRARGRAELKFGGRLFDDATLTAFGAEAENFTRVLLAGRSAGTAEDDTDPHGPDPRVLMARADALIRELGAEDAAASSNLLEAGQYARYGAVARTLVRCVPAASEISPEPGRVQQLRDAVDRLTSHELSALQSHRDSLTRVRMAQRLIQWLARPHAAEFTTVAEAVQHHIADYAWVDLALGWITDGDRAHPELPAALASLIAVVQARRHGIDERFAARLAEETRAGSAPRNALVVEDFARRVLAPVVKPSRAARSDGPALLLVVLDGASAAVAAGLAEQLRTRSWAEYDPVTDTDEPQHRRGMLAALPTITKVSRGSLFAGELTEIDQYEERARFAAHRFWSGATVKLFHKADLRGEAGHPLGSELTEALADPNTHVAVVVNTVDDRLGEDRAMSHWQLNELLGMEELLALARIGGRALVITSDHGHVLDRGTDKETVPDALSARHRTGTTPAGRGEVVLTGRRVVAAQQRITALWDTTLRYGNRQAGYHGGAALAEAGIPVLAFAPYGAPVPKGWRELGPQRPSWWALDDRPVTADQPRNTAPKAKRQTSADALKEKARQQKAAELETGQGALLSFDAIATTDPTRATTTDPVSPADLLVEALRASEIMDAQLASLPRNEPFDGIASAVRALAQAHGILPVTVVAELAGKRAARAAGFAATLQRVLNYDQSEVLTLTDNGRSLRLDVPLLRRQFGLDEAPGGRGKR